MPRLHRPFWVMEQLETALAEGLTVRLLRTVRDRYRRVSLTHFAAAGWMGYLAVQGWMGRAVPMGVESTAISTALVIGCYLATCSAMSTPFRRRVVSYGSPLWGGAALLISVLAPPPIDPASLSTQALAWMWSALAVLSLGGALVLWNVTVMRQRQEPASWLATMMIGRRH